MSKVRNISGGPLDVPLLDRVVEDGEVVEVPDFQPGHTDEDPLPIVWPPNRWEPVIIAAVAPEKARKAPAPLPPEPSPPPQPEAAAVPVPSSDPRER